MKNNKKFIMVAIISIITLYQIFSTISICSGKQNIQMVYQVKEGENIQTVAKKFGTTTEELEKLNGVKVANTGDRLKIN